MGWLDELFDKKFCAFCGKQVNLFNSTKLTDGYICSDCRKVNSPFYGKPKGRSVEQVRRHRQYREENRAQVEQFQVTRTFSGEKKHLYIDETHGWFCFASRPPCAAENPDLFRFEWLTDCQVDVRESETEITYYDDKKQRMCSHRPPRYRYTRSITLDVRVENSPWLNRFSIDCGSCSFEGREPASYARMLQDAERMRTALLTTHQKVSRAAPKRSVLCPHCGATTLPDALGRCEYCMSALEIS